MEVMGVYYEKFVYFLSDQGYRLSIVFLNKISNYMRILDIKMIIDKSCFEVIVRFGLERKLIEWEKLNVIYKILKQLIWE